MKILLPLISATLLYFHSSAQEYVKVYYDGGNSLFGQAISDHDGNGVVLAAKVWEDALLFRVDDAGEIIWKKRWENPVNLYPRFNFFQVLPVADSNFLVVGQMANDSMSKLNCLVMKIDADGNLLWKRSFDNGQNMSCDRARAVQTLDSSGYLICWGTISEGNSFSALTLDANGNTLWARSYSQNLPSGVSSVQILNDSTYLVAGNLSEASSPYYSGMLTAVAENGDVRWSRKYTGLFFDDLLVRDSSLALSGRNLLDGSQYFYSFGSREGTLDWNRSPGLISGSGSTLDKHSQLLALDSGDIILYASQDLWSGMAFQIDATGTIVNSINPDPIMTDMMKTRDNGVLFMGQGPLYGIKQVMWPDHIGTVRTDSTLTLSLCGYNQPDIATDLTMPTTDTLIWSNGSTPQLCNRPITAVTASLIDTASCVQFWGGVEENSIDLPLNVFPTLSDGIYHFESTSPEAFTLTIVSVTGTHVLTMEEIQFGTTVNLGNYENGMYFYTAVNDLGQKKTGSLILHKSK